MLHRRTKVVTGVIKMGEKHIGGISRRSSTVGICGILILQHRIAKSHHHLESASLFGSVDKIPQSISHLQGQRISIIKHHIGVAFGGNQRSIQLIRFHFADTLPHTVHIGAYHNLNRQSKFACSLTIIPGKGHLGKNHRLADIVPLTLIGEFVPVKFR